MAGLSLSQSSFLLSSLLADTPHRLDGRALLAPRSLVLSPLVEAGEANVSLGSTSVSCRISTQVVRGSDQVDEDERGDVAAADEGDEHTKLWSVSIQVSPGCDVPLPKNAASSSSTGSVELDSSLETLSHLIRRHLIARIPAEQLIILRSTSSASSTALQGATFWNVALDITVHSMAGGNLFDAVWAAAYAALWRARIPRTREVAYVPAGKTREDVEMDEVGIKSLKGKGSRAVDFELEDVWDDGKPIAGRELVGVGLTLGMLPNGSHLLDPSLDEELSLPSNRRLFVAASSSSTASMDDVQLLPSLLNLSAGEATDASNNDGDHEHALRFPTVAGAGSEERSPNWETGGWGCPSWQRLSQALGVALPLLSQYADSLRQKLMAEEAEVAR